MITKLNKDLKDLKIGIMGLRAELLSEISEEKGLKYIKIDDVQKIDSSFDIIFGTGIYQVIKDKYLELPKYGIIFFHETPLPEGKGSAPIQWTIENKRTNMVITAFRATNKADAGDIVYQINVGLSPLDSLLELEKKRCYGIQECFKSIIEEMEQGFIVYRKQTGQESYNKKRTANDSELDTYESLINLWDKIRVCDNEKFPAFFKLFGKKIILRYEIEEG